MDKFLTISEAATIINVHPETLRRWDREGELVAIKINDRGDRRYRKSDIQQFMSTHKSAISHAKSTEIGGYEVRWWSEEGFKTLTANFHLIAKIYAVKDKEFIGFAFFVDFLEKTKSGISENELDELAMEKVTEFFESKKVFDRDIVTFEFNNGSFYEVQNPEWWEGKYGKTLVPGLRIEIGATRPVSAKNLAWRVILRFKSKEGDIWTKNTFGSKHNLHEYYIWIDSNELQRKELSNTAKNAEILAIEFGIKRFEETKDRNGDRDITRINENNSAFYSGKWVKDSLLPDDLMN